MVLKNIKEVIKVLDIKGKMKTKEIFNLLKTNSQIKNLEILKKIKSFNKINDFFNHYSNQTSLFEILNKAEFYSSKNYDEIFSLFDLSIEHYISCFTQIIISIKLIIKTQEILNKIFLAAKKYLSKLKIEEQIENISQKNLFFLVENFLNISGTYSSKSFSNISKSLNFDSCNSTNNNLLNHKKFIKDPNLKLISNDNFVNSLKILYREVSTPKFGSKSDKNFDNPEKEYCQTIRIRKDSSLTLSGEKTINLFKDDKYFDEDKKKNSTTKNFVLHGNNANEKKYVNLLEMINDIYKKGIINSEEKIRLKQLVIAKSEKIENLYYNIYNNKFIDQNILRLEITKLLN